MENNMSVLGFYAPDEENGYLSNWYPCSFRLGNYTYASAEQFLMAQKAFVFHDNNAFHKILSTTDQDTIKRLGRRVANYDDEVWSRLRGKILRRGLRAKFQQNPHLLEKLLATGNMVLAECAPRDKIWGIGMGVKNPNVQKPLEWNGQNLLGTVLMEVRSDLRSWAAASRGDIAFVDAFDLPANEIWLMPFPAVCQLPKIREAIDIYAEVVECRNREYNHNYNFFSFWGTLAGLEHSMRTNMGEGLPVTWFYEMKQDIYDLVRFKCY